MPLSHPSDDGPILDAHVPCVRCRYDLAGTHVLGKCPECGLEVVATVAQHADPAIGNLAAPEDPRAASAAVVAITIAPLVAMVLQGSGPALHMVDALANRGRSAPTILERPSWIVAAAVLAAATILAARGLGARRNPTLNASLGAARVRRLVACFAAWSAVLAAAFVASLTALGENEFLGTVVLAVQVLPAGIALLVLAPVLGRAGAISRNYREARQGRQGCELLSITLVAAVMAVVAAPGVGARWGEELGTVAWGLAGVLLFLAFLGLAYVTANGWVIATALRAPRIDPRKLR
jgi:hypothetical protein